MNWPSFIIFKEARRFHAGYLDLAPNGEALTNVKVLSFRGRDYHFAGQCPIFHHITEKQNITDTKNRLIGFALDMVTYYVKEPKLTLWIQDAENVSFEPDTALFYIHWQYPVSYEHDGSSLIGANIYHDGQGDFLIQIADTKSQFATRNKFQNLWSEIAFPLAPAEQFIVKEYFPKKENF